MPDTKVKHSQRHHMDRAMTQRNNKLQHLNSRWHSIKIQDFKKSFNNKNENN